MHPHLDEQLKMLGRSLEAVQGEAEAGRLRVCVLAGPGHGDNMRGIAFCNAVKREHPGCHLTLLMQFTGSMVEFDLGHSAKLVGAVDWFQPIQKMPRRWLAGWLRGRFDVVFDAMPYVVGTYWSQERSCAQDTLPLYIDRQLKADQRLKPFADIYAAAPACDWRLKAEPFSVWDFMSASSGIRVDARDCVPPLELADEPKGLPIPLRGGGMNKERAEVKQCKYVVVHNSAGGTAGVKCAPPEVFDAIVARLAEDKVRCVQVGLAGEPDIAGAIDRRELRLPLVAELIGKALCLIDVEGFLPYVAASMDKRSLVLFGPTPRWLFGQDHNLNLLRLVEGPRGPIPPCPLGCCFQQRSDWAARCVLGNEHCLNFLEPAEAAESAAVFVNGVGAEQKPLIVGPEGMA